ncbi:MAG: alpha-(1-_3)-arabinofuranosyltransferase family protein [Ilumatobacteraceae bacterium]
MRRVRGAGVWLLAAIAYLPSLTAVPGRMPADSKLYLYLDPARLVGDARFSWDTRQFAGWVPHQTIAYLWPSGPWFVAFDRLGVPDWIAHRLWIGTILFLGGLGVRWAAKHLGLAPLAATVAGVVYTTSPYILPYVSRTSVMLLPWAGVGWLLGFTVRAATRSRWRDAALFALVVLTVGAVNATALALIAPAPVLWLIHAAWQRSITWRTAAVTAAKLGALSLGVSLWWIVMLLVQGRHGADVLAYSETLEAVSFTSVSTETLRGLGYWLFYVRDPYAFTTSASADYMTNIPLILVGWVLLSLCLLGLAVTRWSQRRYAALLIGAGILLAVGVHPYADSSPLASPLRDSGLGLALRSSTRALPLSTFGLALGAGGLVSAIAATRWRARHALAPLVVVLALGNLPAAFDGGFVDPALERDQDVPDAWQQAVDTLDAGSTEHRVLQLPGSEFGAFRWGYTVDPPLPGLTDKPLVTRDLLPLGSPAAMDLLYALDNRAQEGALEPGSIAGVARFLGVDTIWVANDLAFDRFRTPRPEAFAAQFDQPVDGLGTPTTFGEPVVNAPDVPMLDEQELAEPSVGTPVPPVELVPVDDPVAIVRAAADVVVMAGSGDGIVDAVAAGLLDGDEAVLYAGDLATHAAELPAGSVPDDALLVVTDSNRDRAMQWRGSQDVLGFTERGGPAADVTRTDTADHRLEGASSTDPADQTVALLEGGLTIDASGYGEPFAYRPEDRPAMAVDGDPDTAWRVADRADPIGESIALSTTDGRLSLLQDQTPGSNRTITRVRVDTADGGSQAVELDERSLSGPGQPITVAAGLPVTITIEAVAPRDGTDSGPSAVGFAELGPVAAEYTRLPTRGLDALERTRPVAIVMTRERVRPTNRWRSDPDPSMLRTFSLPVGRSFDAEITLRLDARAADALVDHLAGSAVAVTSNRRLTGDPRARGSAAVDGDPATAWTTPFGQAVGSSLTATIAGWSEPWLTLRQVVDGRHSTITAIQLTAAGLDAPIDLAVPVPDADGRSRIALSTEQVSALARVTDLTATITAIDPRTTTDRRFGETVELPAAITEIGLTPAAASSPALPECRTDLVSVDGSPIGVVVTSATRDRLVTGEAVVVQPCDGPIELGPGEHHIESVPGTDTGIDVDRITLRSNVPADAATLSPAVSVERGRTSGTATVAPCPDGCWLVMGEGYNDAWSATGPDGDLGDPMPISGGFNGWWLAPSNDARTIEMHWSPQRQVDLALLAGLLAALGCVALVVFDRRRLEHPLVVDSPRLDVDPPTASPGRLALVAAVLIAGTALAIDPAWVLVGLAIAAAIVVIRKPRLLVLGSIAVAGGLGLLMARRQHAYRYPADAAWPVRFDDFHHAGLLVVVLLIAGSLASDERGEVTQPVPRDRSDQDRAAAVSEPEPDRSPT